MDDKGGFQFPHLVLAAFDPSNWKLECDVNTKAVLRLKSRILKTNYYCSGLIRSTTTAAAAAECCIMLVNMTF
jgi:hypothetical protein